MADNLDDISVAVHAETAMAGVARAVSLLEVERLGSHPRVAWVSPGGSIDSVDDPGGHLVGSTRGRPVRTDAMALELHIWGTDRETTRNIMHALIASIRVQAYGSVEFGSYRWITQNEPRAEFATDGEKILLEATIRLAVEEDAQALTGVVTATQTCTFVDPRDESTTAIC